MGRYFGIFNRTKNHSISEGVECWKSNDWCDCHSVMHQFGWDATDKIGSACYDTCNKFVYFEKKNKMTCAEDYEDDDDDIDNIDDIANDDIVADDKINDKEQISGEYIEKFNKAINVKHNQNFSKEINEKIEKKMEKSTYKMEAAFSMEQEWRDKTNDHVPKWTRDDDGNQICSICRYRIGQTAPGQFSPVFYCN